MTLINAAGFRQLPSVCRWTLLACGLLAGGCSHAARKDNRAPVQASKPAAITGIPACDDYLNRYVVCHRAAGIYAGDAVQTRYQQMVQSLQHDANDPNVRPYLSKRCMGLTQQLTTALAGRPCASPAVTPTTSAAPH